MWSDKDIDNAFQRLNPPDPEPTPFPLDAWLRLETELDKTVLERAVRRRVWQFFAAEVAVVALAVLGWLLWPIGKLAVPEKVTAATTAATGSGAASATVNIGKDSRRIALHRRSGAGGLPATAATTAAAEAAGATHSAAATAGADVSKQAVLAKANTPTTAIAAIAQPTTSKTPSAARLLIAATPTRTRITHSRETTHSPATQQTLTAGAASALAARAASASVLGKPAHYEARKTAAATETSAATTAAIASPDGSPYSAMTVAARKRRARNTTEVAAVRSPKEAASAKKLREANAAAIASRIPAPKSASFSTNPETAASSSSDESANATLLPHEIELAPIPAAALPVPLATVAVAPTEIVRPVRQPRLFIGLVAAPDVTTVKFANVESPLLNVGVTLEYRLTSRLRVSTGVLRAKKQYMARRDDYDWGAYQTLVYKHDFQDVDGTCTVLDIPLNLRYDFLVRPNSRLFGSVGLSSFFMQRERYTYDYEENNMYNVWDGGNIINQNRHLLSILNLSAGYERSLSNHWSLQAEPYLKLPLAGVGAGKVKLTSAGVFLGVKYGF